MRRILVALMLSVTLILATTAGTVSAEYCVNGCAQP